jgi:molecular chaperone GrpE
MHKKEDQPRDIPIKFSDSSEEAAEDQSPETAEEQPAQLTPQPVDSEVEAEAADDAHGIVRSDLQAQVDAMMAERSALYDQLLRRQAEFENYRKRVERERAEAFHKARCDVVLEMLPILDNLERALTSLEQSEGDAEALRHGVELIHKQFKDALAKFGLQPVEALGQTFDPHLHEAVTIEASDQHQENTVIEEFQRGYRLGGRLLRPAKVKVASSPER